MLVRLRTHLVRSIVIGGVLVVGGCQSLSDGTRLTAPASANYVTVPAEGSVTRGPDRLSISSSMPKCSNSGSLPS